MRYTTIIDVSEYPGIYRNPNALRVYIHMALKAGYHDKDRDLLDMSIRRLAAETQITVSATRNALRMLEKAQLIAHHGPIWKVAKFVITEAPTTRAKTKQQEEDREKAARREAEQRRREEAAEAERRRREAAEHEGKTDFMIWYEQKMEEASRGDLDAQRTVEKQRAVYEAHKKELEKRRKMQTK